MAWEWLSLVVGLPEVIGGLTKRARTNNATKKLLISELSNNLKYYKLAKRNNYTQAQLITIISNDEIMTARRNGFKFSQVRRGRIREEIIVDIRNSKYKDKDCEWLFVNISDKITELKRIYALVPLPDMSNSNMTRQFSNLFYKMKLLADFING